MLRLYIPNMTCGGCARSVTRALQGIDADASIETNPAAHEVCVVTTAGEGDLLTALSDAGFPAELRAGADVARP